MSGSRNQDSRPTPDGLAGRLRALREATVPRISQTAAARAIASSQNRLSRAEAGSHVLTPDEVQTLCRLYGATRAEQQQLVRWAGALARSTVDARVMMRRGGGTAAFQARIRSMEQSAALVRAYQPGMILGALQTEAYAGVVFRGDEESVRQRMLRNRALLDQRSRRWCLVQPVGALLWNLGGHRVMAEQMEALLEASRRPHVDLRIVTADREASFAVTHGFHVYDDNAAVVGVLTGTAIDTDRATIAEYVALHERLVELAVGGDEARAVIEDVARTYRGTGRSGPGPR